MKGVDTQLMLLTDRLTDWLTDRQTDWLQLRTACCNTEDPRSAHTAVFMCFVWIWEQRLFHYTAL